MAIGNPVSLDTPASDAIGQVVRPISLVTNWQTVVDDATLTDSLSPPNPGAITASTRHWAQVVGASLILVRCKYLASVTTPSGPTVQAFGRDPNGKVMPLATVDGNFAPSLTASVTGDVSDGTNSWTNHAAIDTMGCREVLFLLSTGFSVGSGASTSTIEAKAL